MKIKSIILLGILSLAAVTTGCGATRTIETIKDEPATAAGEKSSVAVPTEVSESKEDSATAALQAYQKILKAAPGIKEAEHDELMDAAYSYEESKKKFGEHFELFLIEDINKDGVPELLASSEVNFRWATLSVYTYANDEAVLLKDPTGEWEYSTFEQRSTADGQYMTYICEENHIHSVARVNAPTGKVEEEESVYALEGTTLKAVECGTKKSQETVYFYDKAKLNSPENVEKITP